MNKFDDQYIKKFQKQEGKMKEKITTTVASTEQEKMREEVMFYSEQVYEVVNLSQATPERQTLFITAIIQNPIFDKLLREHYIDQFGSRGEIIGKLTDGNLQTIIEGVIEVCNDNIETDGRGDDIQTYVSIDNDGRQMNELKTWVRQKLTEK